MDKIQAAFELLYFLSQIDGEVREDEVAVIMDFLRANWGNVTFDIEEVAAAIESLTVGGRGEEFGKALEILKCTTNAQERIRFLDTALDLIAADGKFTKQEAGLFAIMGDSWNIDLTKFLSDRGISTGKSIVQSKKKGKK